MILSLPALSRGKMVLERQARQRSICFNNTIPKQTNIFLKGHMIGQAKAKRPNAVFPRFEDLGWRRIQLILRHTQSKYSQRYG